ncbi:Lacal_2735 family protein [Tenacibaculum retecalamus]|uniref:Lacal_2735 family protein n=1 Tax=Tenacibaculum retecalamus TaxID=3018315 RepID=UPI0023D95A13|nr:Lacal_2735 family protein [Tenacibaculum retecalamus]WBX71053.1 Lacal_2735 family protein [Tenacibaculum retecalamus]
MTTRFENDKSTTRLELRYKKLIEKSSNFKQTNRDISNLASLKATRLLEQINKIKYGVGTTLRISAGSSLKLLVSNFNELRHF